MNILRRLGLTFAIPLFSLLLFLLPLFIGLRFVLDTPQPLERALQSSGVYQAAADSLIKQKIQQANQGTEIGTALSDSGVKQSLAQAITPTYLQNNTEQVLTSIYDWVHGTVARPTFAINLQPVKTGFADNFAIYVAQKIDALPTCTSPITPPTNVNDWLALTCKPAGLTAATISDAIKQEASQLQLTEGNNGDVLGANDIKNKEGQSVFDKLHMVPKIHHYYIISLYVIPVLGVLCGLAIVFWSATRRKGAGHIGRTLITTGIIDVIFAWASIWILNKAVELSANRSSVISDLQTPILKALDSLSNQLQLWWIAFGAGYVVIGVVVLIIVRTTRPKQPIRAAAANHILDLAEPIAPFGSQRTSFNPNVPRSSAPTSVPEHQARPAAKRVKIQ